MEIEREGEGERERERAQREEVRKPIGGRKSGYEVKKTRAGEEMKEQERRRKGTGGDEM